MWTYHSSVSFCAIYLRAISQEMLKIFILDMCLKINYLISYLHLLGTNELMSSSYPLLQWSWRGGILVSPYPSVRMSICGQNRVRSVSSISMWGEIMVPMYRLWLHGLCGLYGPRCPLSPERPLNLITHSLCIFNNTYRILYIFAHIIKQLQKVCFKIQKFEILANSLNL